MTQIFLLANAAAQSFPDPGNWNPFNNTIECVGSGGRGANVSSVGLANGGGGGGGGAYAVAHNVAVTFPVSYVSAPGGSIGAQSDQWTVFGSSRLGSVSGISSGDPCYCYANGGVNPAGPSPGRIEVPVTTAIFPTGFAGGNGGSASFYSAGGGGGGAGGPHGAGTAGTNATGSAAPGNGGAADNNTVPGGTGSGAAGSSGTQWDASHGVGGGGAGAGSNAVHGGAGGMYGGGSGGAFLMNNGVAGVPGDGIIVLTYVPRLPAGTTRIYLYQYGPSPIISSGYTRQFPNPGNWTANNKIECVGPGGGGSGSPLADINNAAGSGGGGGAYAFANNLYPTFPVGFNVAGSVGANAPFNEQQNSTWWNNFTQNAGNIIGRAGASGQSFAGSSSNSSPGAGGSLAYPAGFLGGGGGGGSQNTASSGTGAGGGGGAGGPNGAGAAGVAVSSGNVSGAGGAGDNGHTAGSSGNGISGTQWDQLHGIGGGCAGGPDLTTRLIAGNFGGGGGGSLGNASYMTAGGPAPLGTGGLIVITYIPRTQTRIYLYPFWAVQGSSPAYTRQFPNPGDWNPGNNKVECLGSGGMGINGVSGDVQGNAGSGGGGGGYSFDVNLSPTFPVNFQVVQGVSTPDDDRDSSNWWNNSTWTPGTVLGGYGYPATGFAGGGAGNSSPGAGGGTRSAQGSGNSTNYPAANSAVGGGGGGGGNIGTNVTGGGSGGGAGGPHGAGAAGANGGAGVPNLAGGAGDGGNSPGVSGGSTSGTQWDSLHGVGSGGSSGSSTVAGSAGGNFGGAGGGGFSVSVAGGPASPGLIIITYTPLPYVQPQGQAQIMA